MKPLDRLLARTSGRLADRLYTLTGQFGDVYACISQTQTGIAIEVFHTEKGEKADFHLTTPVPTTAPPGEED